MTHEKWKNNENKNKTQDILRTKYIYIVFKIKTLPLEMNEDYF